jgi:hypothetical protein
MIYWTKNITLYALQHDNSSKFVEQKNFNWTNRQKAISLLRFTKILHLFENYYYVNFEYFE